MGDVELFELVDKISGLSVNTVFAHYARCTDKHPSIKDYIITLIKNGTLRAIGKQLNANELAVCSWLQDSCNHPCHLQIVNEIYDGAVVNFYIDGLGFTLLWKPTSLV